MTSRARYVVAARRPFGEWRRVGVSAHGRPVWGHVAARRQLTRDETRRAVQSFRLRGYQVQKHRLNPWPYIVIDSDTAPCNPDLMDRFNLLGKRLGRQLFGRELKRTRERQQQLWNAFVARNYAPPLTARPGESRHETGEAGDLGVLTATSGRLGIDIGSFPGAREEMRALDLCLPVYKEKWHAERGSTWRA